MRSSNVVQCSPVYAASPEPGAFARLTHLDEQLRSVMEKAEGKLCRLVPPSPPCAVAAGTAPGVSLSATSQLILEISLVVDRFSSLIDRIDI